MSRNRGFEGNVLEESRPHRQHHQTDAGRNLRWRVDVECLHYHLRQSFSPQLQCKQEHSSQKGTRTRSNKQTCFVQKLWQIPWILHISYIYVLQMSNFKIFESHPWFRSVVPHLQPVETSGQIPFGQMPGGPVPGGAKIEEKKGQASTNQAATYIRYIYIYIYIHIYIYICVCMYVCVCCMLCIYIITY